MNKKTIRTLSAFTLLFIYSGMAIANQGGTCTIQIASKTTVGPLVIGSTTASDSNSVANTCNNGLTLNQGNYCAIVIKSGKTITINAYPENYQDYASTSSKITIQCSSTNSQLNSTIAFTNYTYQKPIAQLYGEYRATCPDVTGITITGNACNKMIQYNIW